MIRNITQEEIDRDPTILLNKFYIWSNNYKQVSLNYIFFINKDNRKALIYEKRFEEYSIMEITLFDFFNNDLGKRKLIG